MHEIILNFIGGLFGQDFLPQGGEMAWQLADSVAIIIAFNLTSNALTNFNSAPVRSSFGGLKKKKDIYKYLAGNGYEADWKLVITGSLLYWAFKLYRFFGSSAPLVFGFLAVIYLGLITLSPNRLVNEVELAYLVGFMMVQLIMLVLYVLFKMQLGWMQGKVQKKKPQD